MNASPVALVSLGTHPRAGGSAEGALHDEGEEDACDVLANLTASEFGERLRSKKTGEWMYVFKPKVGEVLVYLKVILRADCIVISFHEEEDQNHEDK